MNCNGMSGMTYPALVPRLLRRLPEVSVGALHVLLGDGDAARHGRPVGLHADPPAEVRAHPSLGVLDDLRIRMSSQFDYCNQGWQGRLASITSTPSSAALHSPVIP